MQLTLVKALDWEGLYINGCLVSEGNRITAEDVVRELNGEVRKANSMVEDYIMETGGLPEIMV